MDELFGGYPTYVGHRIAPIYDALPSPLRALIRKAAFAIPSSGKKMTIEYLLKRFVRDAERPWIERRLRWFGTGLDLRPTTDDRLPTTGNALARAIASLLAEPPRRPREPRQSAVGGGDAAVLAGEPRGG